MSEFSFWRLERHNNKPVIIEAIRLEPRVSPGGYTGTLAGPNSNNGNALFLTKSGRYILHTCDRHRSYGSAVCKVHLDADKLTDHGIIEAMGGIWLARDILIALGRSTEERIE